MRRGSLWVTIIGIVGVALMIGSCSTGFDGPIGAVKGDLDGQASLGVMMSVTDMRAERRTDWDIQCAAEPAEANNPDGTTLMFTDTVTEGPTRTVLTIEGTLTITNGGSGDAPVESIIINLQTKETGPFVTATSVACGDPTQLCDANGPPKVYIENVGGTLEIFDAAGVDVCGDLPTIAAGDTLDFTYRAVFILVPPFDLEEGDHARTEALVTFSNAGERGGSGASCPNPLEVGDYIRTVASRVSGQMPPIVRVNEDVLFCKWISVAPNPDIVTVDDFVITTDSRQITCGADLPGSVPLSGAQFCCTIVASEVEGTVTEWQVTSTATCNGRDGRTVVENTATLTGPDTQDGITGSPAVCQISIVCGQGGGGGGGTEPGDFCTQTQGGWGTTCHGGNPGCLRDANFDIVFPGGLVVGGTHTITLTNTLAVENYLPGGGTPAPLTQDHVNPSDTESGILGAQVVALTLNVEFDKAGFWLDGGPRPGACGGANLADLVMAEGMPCEGMTVQQVLDLANQILGGDGGPLSPSEINECVSRINENFVDCTTDNGYLVCP